MAPTDAFVSSLGPVMSRYLALKEALGRRYRIERAVLIHLDRFLAAQPPDRSQLTAESFRTWSSTFAQLTPTVRRNRMRIARNLCLYHRRSDPHCFVPDTADFPKPHQPQRPHLFTELQIVRLLHAADALRPAPTSPLYGPGLRLAIVLLYTSGIRRGELVRLTLDDYDVQDKLLRIRDTKFHKSRLVPLSGSADREMEKYLCLRIELPHAKDAPLFCTRHGGLRPYTGAGVAQGLRRLFQQADVRTADSRLPRVHDLRHTFAVHALRRWYQTGVDVQSKLPALAAYMGHVSVVSTQYYLAWLDPFADAVSERFWQHSSPFLSTHSATGDIR